MFRFYVLLLLLVNCSVYAATGSVKKIIKEQVVSQPLEYSFKKVFSFINFDYFMTLKQTNRVHSAKRGKGIKVNITNYQPSIKFSVIPIKAIGVQKSLFEHNLLFPGSYKLIANKGTKLAKLNVSKNITVDYYQLVKVTGVKADLSFGRLEVNTKPLGATIKIDNYDIAYHSGVQLPVGEYHISTSMLGYNSSVRKVKILKSKISKIEVSLKVLSSKPKPKPKPSVVNTKLGDVNAPKQKRIEKPNKIKPAINSSTSKDSVERISVTGRLVSRDVYFNFELKDKLRDRVTLVIKNEDDKPIKVSKKTKTKNFVLAVKILPGKYRASLTTKRHGNFDLGEIEVKNQLDNKLRYSLTLR